MDLLSLGKSQLKMVECMRLEFNKIYALLLEQRNQLYKLDELEMATMRLQLRSASEEISETERNFRLLPEEIPAMNQVNRFCIELICI